MKRFWPLIAGIPLLAGLVVFRMMDVPGPAPAPALPKNPERPSRVIEGVRVIQPEPSVVTMPATPENVADPVNRSRVRSLVNQAIVAGVRGDATTRDALVRALKKETMAGSEIRQMKGELRGSEAVHLAAIEREVAP